MEKVFLQILSLTLIFVSSQRANAADDFIYPKFKDYLMKAKALGVQDINGESVSLIITRAKEIEIDWVSRIEPNEHTSIDGTYRTTAHWDKEKNKITFSSYHINKLLLNPPGSLKLETIIAHEYFGALNIFDDNFSTTSPLEVIVWMHRLNKNSLSEHGIPFLSSEAPINLFAEQIKVARGGSTGVGGGGDGRISQYSWRLYHELFKLLNKEQITTTQARLALGRLATVKIEFSEKVPQGEVRFSDDHSKILVPPNSTMGDNFSINTPKIMSLIKVLIQAKEG